jgi:tryptophanyl-tRNA synthetase
MYTDPNHLKVSDPGQIEGNVVFTYLDAFHPDKANVAAMKAHYQAGGLGDRVCKNELEMCLQELIAPMRERAMYMQDKGADGDAETRNRTGAGVTQGTLREVKMGLGVPVF